MCLSRLSNTTAKNFNSLACRAIYSDTNYILGRINFCTSLVASLRQCSSFSSFNDLMELLLKNLKPDCINLCFIYCNTNIWSNKDIHFNSVNSYLNSYIMLLFLFLLLASLSLCEHLYICSGQNPDSLTNYRTFKPIPERPKATRLLFQKESRFELASW